MRGVIFKILLVAFIAFVLIGVIDLSGLDQFFYWALTAKPNYDLPFWQVVESSTTLTAILVALFTALKSIHQAEEQLRVEQEPYVVIAERIDIQGIESGGDTTDKYLKIRIRNIGRGPAIRITVNNSPSNPDKAFLNKSEPHSVDLASNSQKFGLVVDESAMKKTVLKKNGSFRDEKTPLVLFIHFRNQLGGRRRIKVKLKRVGGFLQVMEHSLVPSFKQSKIVHKKLRR